MRALLCLLLALTLAPSTAAAQATSDGEAVALKPAELRKKIQALPKDDPAVAYARDLQLEGGLISGSAIGFVGGMVGIALGEVLAAPAGRKVGPSLVGVGLGLGLGAAAIGLPPLLDGRRFLVWYATHDPPPTRLARLKLLRRWRIASLSSRRTAGLIGTGFLGVSGIVAGTVWASRDATGVNGAGTTYDPTDAFLFTGMVTGAVATATVTILAHRELVQEKKHPHRLYAPKPAPAAAAVVAPVPGLDGSVGLAVALTVVY